MKVVIPVVGVVLLFCPVACSDDDETPQKIEDENPSMTGDPISGDQDAGSTDSPTIEMDGGTGDGAAQEPKTPPVGRFTEDDYKDLANPGNPDRDETCDDPVNEEDCDTSKRPIVFVHGTIASGDNLAGSFQLFASNGYCSSFMKAVDYNSLGDNPNEELDAIIAQLQEETGFDQVDLSGHSQGSGHAARYAAENPEKIARYIHLAGGCPDNDPGGVPTLTLSSIGDMPVEECGTTANFCHQNAYIDHFAVASSIESFVEMYKFLNDGEEPATTTVKCEDNIVLEGRAISYGDCAIIEGGKIEVYELGDEPWDRGDPVYSFDIDADGWVGPFNAKRGVYYEFKMIPPADKADTLPLRYTYMPPFARSDRWIRFLYKSENAMVNSVNSQVNFGDNHAVILPRMKRGGIHYGQHSVLVDGFDIVNEENAPTPATNVGYYLFDAKGEGEGESNGGSIVSGTFVNSCDVYMQAAEPAFIEVNFGTQTVKVPNWPSGDDIMSLILFD